MTTIYLDKQVFSHLFKRKSEKYTLLREKILAHRDTFIFLYSNAHLFDLQDDQTDIKYAEMDFMQSIVDSNHIIYENAQQQVARQSPRDAFKDLSKIEDLSWLENIDLSKITTEQRTAISNLIDISLKDLNGELDFDWLIKRVPLSVDEFQVDKSTLTSFTKVISLNFYKSQESYKIIRDNTIAQYNPSLITAEDETIFNEQLSSSPLGLSFLDLIKTILTQIGLSSPNSATIYYMSYMLLDLLGINKEARKKVKFRNMEADCYHSFFGSYCDCIVSEDEGLRKKSKTLYKLFNFGTQVYSIDEQFDEAIHNNQKSTPEYFNEITIDYQKRQVLKTIHSSPQYTLTSLKTFHKYFGYFNCMLERQSQEETIIILHKNMDLRQPILTKEIEIIVNRIVRVFNAMGANLPSFDEKTEFPLLQTDNWHRSIIMDDTYVGLTKFKELPMLCLWIRLKHPMAQN